MANKLLNSEEKIAAMPSVQNESAGRSWTLANIRFEVEKVREILILEG